MPLLMEEVNGEIVLVNPLPEIPLPSNQSDLDGDGIGDQCDEDMDGDDVHNEHDCDPQNNILKHDRDEDGVCDPINRATACNSECTALSISHQFFDLQACRDRCDFTDNCVDRLSTLCAGVSDCTSAEAAESESTCSAALGCTFVPGPRWPFSSYGNVCLPSRTSCNEVYSNVLQRDLDGDLIGDRCDWFNIGKPDFENNGGFQCYWDGSHFHCPTVFGNTKKISFHAWGGDAVLVNNQVVHQPQTRSHTQIGACHCDVHRSDGLWDPMCETTQRCPVDEDTRTNEQHTAWTPVQSPSCSSMPYSGDPLYEAVRNQYGICYHRELPFSRDESTNYQEFIWTWGMTRSFPDASATIGADYSVSMSGTRSTQVRVAWPDGTEINFNDPVNREREFSTNKRLNVTYLSDLGDLAQSNQPGPIPPHFAVAPRGPFDPIGPISRGGYLITEDQISSKLTLLALASGTPEVTRVFEASFATDGIDTAGELAGAAGALDSSLVSNGAGTVPGVFVYQGPASPARLFVGYEKTGSSVIDFVSTETLWESQAPAAYNVKLMFVPGSQELLLFGSLLPGGPRDRIWRLRLSDGSWEGPVTPAPIRGLRGYSVSYDPIKKRAILFGGTMESQDIPTDPEQAPGPPVQTVTATVRSLDIRSLTVKEIAPLGAVPVEIARTRHGAGLDVVGRALYVQGGERGSSVTDDAWRFDLRTRQWISEGYAGPATIEPLVHYDRDHQSLWIGDFTGASIQAGLSLWGRDASGSWYQTPALTVQSAVSWPVSDVYRSGRTGRHLWSSDPGTMQPGQYWLAQLDSAEPALGMTVQTMFDTQSITSEMESTGLQVAGFLCPSGQRCVIEVNVLPGAGSHDQVPYQLDVVEAAPTLETFTNPVGFIRDLVLTDSDRLTVVGSGKIKVLDRSTLAMIGKLQGHEIAGATAAAPCGSKLCVSRNRLLGLTVVDLGDGSTPQVVSRQFTSGPAKDIAVNGGMVYLAQGALGVGVYDVSNPAAPSQVRFLQPETGLSSWWHRIVSVAVGSGRLLAAAEKRGTIHLYDLSASHAHVGTINVPGCNRIKRVRFRGRHLWVLTDGPARVAVYNVDDPAVPQPLGTFTQNARKEFRATYAGIRRFTYAANLLSVYRLEPVVP